MPVLPEPSLVSSHAYVLSTSSGRPLANSLHHEHCQSANNVTSHSKRSVTTAVVVSCGGVGGIIASTVFRQQDAPHYIPGLWVTMGWQILLIALLGVITLHFRRLNKKLSKGNLEGPLEGHPGIKYTL